MTRTEINNIVGYKLNLHEVEEDADLNNVLTFKISCSLQGRIFRAKSQYVYTSKREYLDPSCQCDTRVEYLLEIPEMQISDDETVPAWAGWVDEVYAVAPSRERIPIEKQDPTGSWSRKFVNSALPPYLRAIVDGV
jgi:hypothetical protein